MWNQAGATADPSPGSCIWAEVDTLMIRPPFVTLDLLFWRWWIWSTFNSGTQDQTQNAQRSWRIDSGAVISAVISREDGIGRGGLQKEQDKDPGYICPFDGQEQCRLLGHSASIVPCYIGVHLLSEIASFPTHSLEWDLQISHSHRSYFHIFDEGMDS